MLLGESKVSIEVCVDEVVQPSEQELPRLVLALALDHAQDVAPHGSGEPSMM